MKRKMTHVAVSILIVALRNPYSHIVVVAMDMAIVFVVIAMGGGDRCCCHPNML
jgi:hypothetical protein